MVGDWYQDSADKSHSDGLIMFDPIHGSYLPPENG